MPNKFQNGSRIIAFSSNPYAMAVYGGDVGLDEFAKHPNASLLWQTAQGRVTWGSDLAVWSSQDGEDTLFHQFAREARAACSQSSSSDPSCGSGASIQNPKSKIKNPSPIQNQNSKSKNTPEGATPNTPCPMITLLPPIKPPSVPQSKIKIQKSKIPPGTSTSASP